MKAVSRYARLLPAVIVVGAVLLGMKGEGLVRSGWALEPAAPPSEASLFAHDSAPPAKDTAVESGESSSAAETDVLTSLAKRRAALDAREADINSRADLLAATEQLVNDKIAALKQIQDQITTLLGQRDAEQEKQIAALVKTYSAMRPKDAARIFDNLTDDVLIPVAREMKADTLAGILAAMNPAAAQKLTVKLAGWLKLPDTVVPAGPPAPQSAAPQPAVGQPQAVTAQPPAAAAQQSDSAQPAAAGSHG